MKCNTFRARKNRIKGLVQFKNRLYCVFVRVLHFLALMSLPLNSLSSVHFRIMLLINRQHRLDPLMTGADHWRIIVFLEFKPRAYRSSMTGSLLFRSINSDATSGKEMSDGNEGSSRARSESRVRKNLRKSSRTRSRQDKMNRPKLTMIKVSPEHTVKLMQTGCLDSSCQK